MRISELLVGQKVVHHTWGVGRIIGFVEQLGKRRQIQAHFPSRGFSSNYAPHSLRAIPVAPSEAIEEDK